MSRGLLTIVLGKESGQDLVKVPTHTSGIGSSICTPSLGHTNIETDMHGVYLL